MILRDKELMRKHEVSDFLLKCGYFKLDLCKKLERAELKPYYFELLNKMVDFLERSVDIARCYEHDMTWYRVNQTFYAHLVDRNHNLQMENDSLKIELAMLKEKKQ